MNNGAPGQPPAQGQPRPHPLFRPEQMRTLPDTISLAEKTKWENGLKNLWHSIENNPEDSQAHKDAKQKLNAFSGTLAGKLRALSQPNAAGARPASQAQPAGAPGLNGQNPNGQPRPQIPQKILDHVNTFPFTLPPQITSGTPDATKWLQEAKSRYVKGLMAMDAATVTITQMDAMQKKRNDEGKPFNPQEEKDFVERRGQATKRHAEAKNFVDNFRAQQQDQHRKAQAARAAAAGVTQPPVNAPQPSGAENGNVAQPPARPQMSLNQPSNPAVQNTQTINAAIEAARTQQNLGSRAPMPQNGQPSMPNQNGAPVPQHQGSQVQNIKQEAGVPHINTQMQRPSLQNNNSPRSAVPQSAQSMGPHSAINGQPVALTHPQALQQVSRTYSSGQTSGTPNVMGHSSLPRETPNSIKMPIPKSLPDRATQQPQPVAMPPSRPSYSGGANNAGNGILGQPVIQKPPGYNMDGDGEHLMNKKKLDELVRQVTGGGEGLGGGEVLTPDVEESILTVADTFVDQVLQAACKHAKERGSQMLEIRDIQLALERGYNIRIPGYASDEIRTVRKIQPAAAWISKMSAVQASKVTGGKIMD